MDYCKWTGNCWRHLWVLGMVLWQNQISICSLALWKSRTECCPNFDIHFGGWVTGGMLPKFWYPCTLQTQGECCPNFDIHFMAWALPGTPKSSPNHIKIHPKSTQNHQKLVLGVALGAPGLPLEASWAPLGAQMPKSTKKWLDGPPQEVPKEVIFEDFSILFRVLFLVPVLVPFLATFRSPWELKK